MTDEKFVFVSDVKDKKYTARSAKNRVRGGGRKCTMPSDRLTEKEKKAMNGEVKTYDITQPIKWAEYKKMPDDLKKEYLLRLSRLYHARIMDVADMLGVSAATLIKENSRLGMPPAVKGQKKPTPEWNSFIKYGTPKREGSQLGDLIPSELREKLDRFEEEHPPAVVKEGVNRDALSKVAILPAVWNNPTTTQGQVEPAIVPDTGDIRIKGTVSTVGKTLALLLGDRKMSFGISWEVEV